MSGGSLRSGETKRSNRRSISVGIDIGDGEAIADGGVGGRAAALAENAEAARIVHDVVDGEEIGRVVELGDQRELLFEACRAPCRGCRSGKRQAAPSQVRSSRCDCGVLPCGTGSSGYSYFSSSREKVQASRDLDGACERVLMAFEQPRHLAWRFQMPLGIGFEAEAGLVQSCISRGCR